MRSFKVKAQRGARCWVVWADMSMRKRRVRELLRRNIGVIVMIWIMEILVLISGGMITLGMIGGVGSIDEVVCVNDS